MQKQENTIPDKSSGASQRQHTGNELPTFEKENTTLPNNSQPCNPKETLAREQRINL